MKAIIMAGGSGQRLRPLTCLIPKPLVPVMGKPVMAYAVESLQKLGIGQIGATLAYRAQEMQDHFADGLQYFIEESPMGTAGAMRLCGDFLDERFVVMSGDALTDIDLAPALDFHKRRGAMATLVLKQVETPLEYGVVLTDETGRVLRFLEKPGWSQVFSDTVNTGIYILEPEVLSLIPKEGSYDFGKQLFPKMLEMGLPMYGFVAQGYWCDIGDAAVYRRAVSDGLQGKIQGLAPCIEEGAVVEAGAHIHQPVFIGAGSVVRAGAQLGPNVSLGRNCHVQPGASLRDCVVWDGALIERRAELREALVLDHAQVLSGSQMYADSILGSGAVLGSGAALLDQSMVWPGKSVPANTRVKGSIKGGESSIVWTARGIEGESSALPGVDALLALGKALGAQAKKKSYVIAGDGSGAAQMATQALSAGLMAGAVQVMNAGLCSAQAMLLAQEEYDGGGAAYATMRGGKLFVDLYDREGLELSVGERRALQAGLARVELAAVELGDIPAQTQIPNASALHLVRLVLLADLDAKAGKARVQAQGGPMQLEAKALFDERGQLSATVSADGERIVLTDEKDRELSEDAWSMVLAHVAHAHAPGAPILATQQATMGLDVLAKAWGVELRRCNPSRRALMELTKGHDLYKTLYFDGMGALVLLLSALEKQNMRLCQLVDLLPKTFRHVERIACKNEKKGRTLRVAADRLKGRNARLDHGIFVNHGELGWAMIAPDEDREEFLVTIEAMNAEFAQELFADYKGLLNELATQGEGE